MSGLGCRSVSTPCKAYHANAAHDARVRRGGRGLRDHDRRPAVAHGRSWYRGLDWTPLRGLLEDVGLLPGTVELLLTGIDRGIEGDVEQEYQRSLPLEEALREDVLLAWSMNDAPLEPQHGFPVRPVAAGWYGMAHVKWLRSIEALREPFTGYRRLRAYRYGSTREESGEPVTSMRVRSLMIPPGIPDFMTRTRVVQRGLVELAGRAWSARVPIARVDVSSDAGSSWTPAAIDDDWCPHVWQTWRFNWEASEPGAYELCCRATDTDGNQRPIDRMDRPRHGQ